MLEFDFDGQESILFWITDPETDEMVRFYADDLSNLKAFLWEHFRMRF